MTEHYCNVCKIQIEMASGILTYPNMDKNERFLKEQHYCPSCLKKVEKEIEKLVEKS